MAKAKNSQSPSKLRSKLSSGAHAATLEEQLSANIEHLKNLSRLSDRIMERANVRISAPMLSDFVHTWHLSPRTSQTELERLRAFVRFCANSRWITHNPASAIRGAKPKI